MPGSALRFWRGFSLYQLDYFISKCDKEIFFALLNGETRKLHLDLKEFSEHKIYSIRLNREDRVLLVEVEDEKGNKYILFLERIDNHDYQKSIYLKPGNLTAFLEKNKEQIHQFISSEDFFSTYSDSQESLIEDSQESLPPVYFSFSQMEEEYSYPIFVKGPAGSGKTTWLVNHFEKEILKEALEPKRILFLSDSPERLHQQFLRTMDEGALEEVHFLTYAQLLKKHFLPPAVHVATKANFEQWYETYSHLPKHKKFFKTQSVEKILQEFAVIAMNTNGYLSLGMRACLFQSGEERSNLLLAFKDFGKFLQEKKLVCSFLFYLECNVPFYDYVFVDNAQDLSPIYVKLLLEINKTAHFVFAMDPAAQGFKMDSYIQQALTTRMAALKLKDEITTITLEQTFRCSQKIVNFATKVLAVKDELIGKSEKTIIHSEAHLGEVLWESSYPNTTQEFSDYIKRLKKHINVTLEEIVLVVSQQIMPEFLASHLLDQLPNLKVCTPQELKTLEYSVVIFWRPFDNSAMYSNLNKLMSNRLLDKKLCGEEFAQALGELYALTMRAKKCLVFLQEDSHACHQLVDLLKDDLQGLSDSEEPSQFLMPLRPAKTALSNKRNRLFIEEDKQALSPDIFLRVAHTA